MNPPLFPAEIKTTVLWEHSVFPHTTVTVTVSELQGWKRRLAWGLLKNSERLEGRKAVGRMQGIMEDSLGFPKPHSFNL